MPRSTARSPPHSARAHLVAARLHHEEDADPETIAAHLLHAPVADEDWALASLREAASQARRRGSPRSALEYLKRAIREPMASQMRGELLLELARVESVLGEETGAQHATGALDLVEESRRAESCWVLGDCLYKRGKFGEAASAFEKGLELLSDPDDPMARDLHAGYFSAASVDISFAPRALAHIAPVRDQLPAGDTPAERAVLSAMAVGRWTSGGARAEVVELARRAWGGGRLLADEGPSGWAWSLVTAAFTMTDELEAASSIAEEVMDQARSNGSLIAYATASYCAASAARRSGQIAQGRALVEATIDAVRDGWNTYPCSAYSEYANDLILYDELDAAEQALAITDDPAHFASVERAMVLEARGRLRMLQGRNAEALEDFLAAGEILERSSWRVSFFAWRAGAAMAAHHVGDEARARELADWGLEIAEETQIPSYMARMLRAKALVGDSGKALGMLERALSMLEHSQARLEYLYSLFDLGSALRRAGKLTEARARLEQAMDLAHRFGARLVARQAHEELRLAGSRPRQVRFTGVEALTAGERRVAEMAAGGMSNREIAQALFVTTRAVEKHLYNCYCKLQIATRRELATVLRA